MRPDRDLSRLAEQAGSSGLAAVADGEVLLHWGADEPVLVQSVTKLVVALGVGIALHSGGDAVQEASRPLGEVFPEWRDERADITIVDLLAHRSGLRPVPPHELESAADPLQLALRAPFVPEAALRFTYNNAGPFVVAAAVERLTGRSVTEWLETDLFVPLGVRAEWARGPGGVLYHGGLVCTALALATIGDAARTGTHVPHRWVRHLVETGSSAYPQCAWLEQSIGVDLVRRWRAAGVPARLLAGLDGLSEKGMTMPEVAAALPHSGVSALFAELAARGLPKAELSVGPTVGWGHDGDGGQWLLVSPERGLAAAHTRAGAAYHRLPAFFPPEAVLAAVEAGRRDKQT